MEPLPAAFVEHIRGDGVEIPPLPWKRLDESAKHQALYASAGLGQVDTRSIQVGYALTVCDEGWDILWFSDFRGILNPLLASELAWFRQDHQAEIERVATDHGIGLNADVLMGVRRKPLAM